MTVVPRFGIVRRVPRRGVVWRCAAAAGLVVLAVWVVRWLDEAGFNPRLAAMSIGALTVIVLIAWLLVEQPARRSSLRRRRHNVRVRADHSGQESTHRQDTS